MRLHLPRRPLWRGLIYLCCLILLLFAIDLIFVEASRGIDAGFQTTRVTSPTMGDGSIDYLMALDQHFGSGVTPQNNAAPLLLQAVGRAALPKNQPPDGITDRLGMPHLPEHGDYFVSFTAFAKTNKPDEVITDAYLPSGDWPITHEPVVLDWLKANEKPLALYEQASQRARFWIPYFAGYRPQTLASVLLPHVSPMLGCANALLIRGATELESHDADGFIRDMLAVHRMARLLASTPTLVERRVAIRLEGAVCREEREAATMSKLAAPDARRLALALSQLPDFPSLSDRVDQAERCMALDAIQLMNRAGPANAGKVFNAINSSNTGIPDEAFRFLPIDYEHTMKNVNHWVDGAIVSLNQPTYRQRAATLGQWNDDLNKLSRKRALHRLLSGDWAVTLFMPDLLTISKKDETAKMENRIARVALALSAWRADHGSYPATLDELVPKDLPSLPEDSFSNQPLLYSRHAAGYRLYSVGPNLTDDNAVPTSDDIAAVATDETGKTKEK